MIVEITLIIVSSSILFLVYFSRVKNNGLKTFLFSENFLNSADEKIFDFVKFVFKMYSLLEQNVTTFVSKIPHKVAHTIHEASHSLAVKSSKWVDKITHKTTK